MKVRLLLTVLIFIVGCSITGNVGEVPSEVTQGYGIYFCPRDDCAGSLVKFLGAAKESIHCALFDIGLEEVKDVLARKSKEVEVKVVMDNNYKEKFKGKNVRYDDDSQLSHNKFCVVDGNRVSTGSFNPTERGAHKNNNNFIVFFSETLAENYDDEFFELWNGEFGGGGGVRNPVVELNGHRIENYFCPEDQCKERVIKVLMEAEESIYFMTFSFTNEEIADALLFSDAEVKGVFETTQAGSKYSQYHRLNDFGMNVKKDSNPYNMHHKTFIVDGEIVITGSYNPTGAGSDKNDENVVVIYDKKLAGKYLEEFWKVWGEG